MTTRIVHGKSPHWINDTGHRYRKHGMPTVVFSLYDMWWRDWAEKTSVYVAGITYSKRESRIEFGRNFNKNLYIEND